jgi:hypothetical protein
MKRVFTVSLCLFAIMAFSSTSFAQDVPDLVGTGQVTGFTPTEVVLYDQTGFPGTNSTTSQNFETANDGYDNQGADDFVVPAGETWTIEGVDAPGAYFNGVGPATDFNVFFYSDAAGVPGTLVEQRLLSAYTDPGGLGSVSITLSPAVVLPEGTYWVSVQCDMDLGVGGQWGWLEHEAVLAPSHWQNPGGLFGTPCTTWGPRVTSCGVGAAPYFDNAFILNGTSSTGGACNLFSDGFDADIAQWTIVGPDGLTNWEWILQNFAGGIAPGELEFYWSPSFTGDSYIMSPVMPSAGLDITVSFQHFIDWYADPMTVGCAYTIDGGTTWTTIWSIVDPGGDVGPELVVANAPGHANFQLGFFFSGNAFNINWFDIDDVCVDGVVPVELTAFTASVNGRNVTLNWTTATETNNQGFEIERNSGNGFQNVGYVAGFGTSTEPHSYSFLDASLSEGTHSYRLKQLDFDGTFEYFDAIEVDIAIPDVFALAQNYPNPFNPSTKIDFSLAVDSRVSLKVFDILGQEVANLVNTNLAAGSHNVDFNASLLNSGVYFYRIEATGIDGTNFTNVKKMILTK